jgi:hypothetical protein
MRDTQLLDLAATGQRPPANAISAPDCDVIDAHRGAGCRLSRPDRLTDADSAVEGWPLLTQAGQIQVVAGGVGSRSVLIAEVPGGAAMMASIWDGLPWLFANSDCGCRRGTNAHPDKGPVLLVEFSRKVNAQRPGKTRRVPEERISGELLSTCSSSRSEASNWKLSGLYSSVNARRFSLIFNLLPPWTSRVRAHKPRATWE